MKNNSKFKKFINSSFGKKLLVVAVLVGVSGVCFAEDWGGAIKTKLEEIVDTIQFILGMVTALLAVVGTISCAIAAWNNKQDLPEHIKKWVIGIAIAGLATIVAGVAKNGVTSKITTQIEIVQPLDHEFIS